MKTSEIPKNWWFYPVKVVEPETALKNGDPALWIAGPTGFYRAGDTGKMETTSTRVPAQWRWCPKECLWETVERDWASPFLLGDKLNKEGQTAWYLLLEEERAFEL